MDPEVIKAIDALHWSNLQFGRNFPYVEGFNLVYPTGERAYTDIDSYEWYRDASSHGITFMSSYPGPVELKFKLIRGYDSPQLFDIPNRNTYGGVVFVDSYIMLFRNCGFLVSLITITKKIPYTSFTRIYYDPNKTSTRTVTEFKIMIS